MNLTTEEQMYRDDLEAAHRRIRNLEAECERLRGMHGAERRAPRAEVRSVAAVFARLLGKRVAKGAAVAIGLATAMVLALALIVGLTFAIMDLATGPCSATDMLCRNYRSYPRIIRLAPLLLPAMVGFTFLARWTWRDAKAMAPRKQTESPNDR